MSFVTVVPNIIVEAVSAAVDIVLDVIDGGFFNDWGRGSRGRDLSDPVVRMGLCP